MSEEILCVRGLSVHSIVKEVNFSLYAKEVVALVGESGSGKTTTAHALLGLSPFVVSGTVLFDGENILKLSQKELRLLRGKELSMIFQDPALALNPVYTIGDQIAEVFEIHTGCLEEDAKRLTEEVLEKVRLSHIQYPFETYPHELSGGMKQRVLIAMALALGPKVLIADEPTSALDRTVQREILELLKDYCHSHSMALLLITHDFDVVQQLADRVFVMFQGEIIEEASCGELFSQPIHPYTKALMQARPTKENRKQMLPTVETLSTSSGCAFYVPCPFTESLSFVSVSKTHRVRAWRYAKDESTL